MGSYNTGAYGYPAVRLEDGKVLGRLKEGVRPSYPTMGGQDFRFFLEPLSPVPAGFEESLHMGFTGFMSRVGYDVDGIRDEEEAWSAIEAGLAGQLVLFTPTLRNNKFFVIDDPQREPCPQVLDADPEFMPVPVFSAEDAAFDGDVNQAARALLEKKPLPGLSKKFWNAQLLPELVAVAFRHPSAPKKRMYALFAPMGADSFRSVVLSEGGAYFETEGPLAFSVTDLSAPDIAKRILLCRSAPLLFVPRSLLPSLKKELKPLPQDGRVVPELLERRGGFPLLHGNGKALSEGAGKKEMKKEPARKESERKETEKAEPVKEKELTERAFLNRFAKAANLAGLLYETRDLLNFHVAMKSSRLVILAGMSGSGKSALVRRYAEALGLPAGQCAMLAVRPSWMDDSDLLGYADTKSQVYRPADTGLAELLIEAARHPERMYLVCFDEMNLARAEHYFAQFISVLESAEPVIRLYNPALAPRLYNSAAYPAEIPVGRNVLFTGTVNVDESTYHFSDKILDRANVITLHRLKFRALAHVAAGAPEAFPEVPSAVYRGFCRECPGFSLTEREAEALDALNDALEAAGVSCIGYRAARQIGRYLGNIPDGTRYPRGEAFDCQLVQRVFTKLRGSSEELKPLIGIDEKGKLTGAVPASLAAFRDVSDFAESERLLARKARELSRYDYVM